VHVDRRRDRRRPGGVCAVLIAVHLVAGAGPVAAESVAAIPTGRSVMTTVEQSSRGNDVTAAAKWRLISASGRERVRQTRFFRHEDDEDKEIRSRWLLVFDSPRDVKGTSLLVWSPRDASDDAQQWIFLGSYRKVKRVAAGSRGNSFMGTDFAFEDLGERPIDDDDHRYVRAEEVNGVHLQVVESVPTDEDAPYSKRLQWVEPKTGTTRKVEFYDRRGAHEKTLVMDWQEFEGAWVATRLDMFNHASGHRTIVSVGGIRVDRGLEKNVFSPNRLGRSTP